MNNKSRQAFIELLIIIGVIVIVIDICTFGIFNKYIFGNRQIVDFKQNFNIAYVLADNGKFERMKIKAWKDWENSDSIQVIDENGKPIYTHLMNVKLTHE